MFTSERHGHIVDLLEEDGKVAVKHLSELYNVSEDCIRKDLKALEATGVCKRVYGGAISTSPKILERNVFHRKHIHLEDKKELAKKAYDLIEDGETIFLDVSTTNILLAELLAKGNKSCNIVSNMIEILQILAKNPNLSVVGTGGKVNIELNGFVGSSVVEMIDAHYFDRAFIGTTGIDYKNLKITTFDLIDGSVKKAIINNTKIAYLLMEKDKFDTCGTYKFASLKDIDYVITNDQIALKDKELLKKNKIEFL